MKRVFILFSCIVLVFGLSLTSFAGGNDSNSTDENNPPIETTDGPYIPIKD